jgi:hypothetical protein
VPIPAYSTRLYLGSITVAQSYVHLFTVPAGYRVVIRDIELNQVGGASNELLLHSFISGPTLFRATSPTGSSGTSHTVRIVLHEGESCYGRALGVTAALCLSGYLLFGPGAPLVPTVLPTQA